MRDVSCISIGSFVLESIFDATVKEGLAELL